MATISVEFTEDSLRAAIDAIAPKVSQLEAELNDAVLNEHPLHQAERAMDGALLWFELSGEKS